MEDHRHPAWVKRSVAEIVRSPLFAIIADCEDQDALRGDPVFQLIAGRSPEGDDLASQPMVSRFEHAIAVDRLRRLPDAVVGSFIASFDERPVG